MMRAQELVQLCKNKQCTIASCESLTAGLFTSTIASVPGASSVLKGGFVTYFTEMKEKLVHVPESIVLEYGVVSAPCARAMAENARRLTGADYCVSFTGNAGPDTMEDKPAGCVYCAIASAKETVAFHFQWDGMERNQIREAVVNKMIDCCIDIIQKEENHG
ncbi:MAG: CinA family protein [Erysipelotrichaceae bacterium]|nr:CinA family protein [Erysipelotrichaceae bacterium]